MSALADGCESEADSSVSGTIRLDPRFYSREAVLKASYWFTNVAYVHLPESTDGKFIIRIKLKSVQPTLDNPKPISIHEFIGEFCNSLLDFELRRQVEAETASLRHLILAKAFSESGVLEDEPPGSIADPVETSTPSSLRELLSPSSSTSE